MTETRVYCFNDRLRFILINIDLIYVDSFFVSLKLFGCLPFWSSSILDIFYFGHFPFWSFSILVIFFSKYISRSAVSRSAVACSAVGRSAVGCSAVGRSVGSWSVVLRWTVSQWSRL